jgi:serine/threonine protein kinase
VRLTDFGLAKPKIDQSIEAGMRQTTCGTPLYLSPVSDSCTHLSNVAQFRHTTLSATLKSLPVLRLKSDTRLEMLQEGVANHLLITAQVPNRTYPPPGKQVDWWMLGVLTFELLFGTTPYTGRSMAELLDVVANRQPTWPDAGGPGPGIPVLSREARGFVEQLLIKAPLQRLGSEGVHQVQQHEWFSAHRARTEAIDWEALLKKTKKPLFVPEDTGDMTRHFPANMRQAAVRDSDFMAPAAQRDAAAAESDDPFASATEPRRDFYFDRSLPPPEGQVVTWEWGPHSESPHPRFTEYGHDVAVWLECLHRALMARPADRGRRRGEWTPVPGGEVIVYPRQDQANAAEPRGPPYVVEAARVGGGEELHYIQYAVATVSGSLRVYQ